MTDSTLPHTSFGVVGGSQRISTRIERDAFIEEQVAHRLLDIGNRRFAQSDDEINIFSTLIKRPMFCLDGTKNTILFNNDLASSVKYSQENWILRDPVSPHFWRKAWRRDLDFLNSTNDLRSQARFFACFTDRTFGNDFVRGDLVLPVFQFNRYGNMLGAILWPLLPLYHRIGGSAFVGATTHDMLPFRSKKPAVVWRGGLTGISPGGYSARDVLRWFDIGRINTDVCQELLLELPRYNFVAKYGNHPACDVGIASTVPLHDQIRYQRPWMERSDLLTFRYQVVIGGNDLATNAVWPGETNTVMLRQDYVWQSFCDVHYRAWEHYVPLRSDLSDLIEKFEWCEHHLDACEEIIANSQHVSLMLADRNLRRICDQQVMRRLETAIRAKPDVD